MNMIRSHKILFFYALIILLGIMFNLLSFFWFDTFHPSGLRIGSENFVNGGQNLSYRLLSHDDPQKLTFSTHISKLALSFSEGDYAVIFFQLNGQAYSVYFNGVYLGTVGDMENGNSNIWNSVDYFYFDKDIVREDNVLSIQLFCLYDRGFSFMPAYIVPAADVSGHFCCARFYTESIIFLAIGICIFAGIIVFKLFLMSAPKNHAFCYFALSIVLLGGYLFDYTKTTSLPMDYLTYKKLVFGCLYAAMAFASLGMFRFFHRKTHLILAAATFAGYLPIALFVNDIIVFKACYDYYNLILIVNLISWIFVTARYFKVSDEAKMFFIGNIYLLFCAVIDVYMTVTGRLFSLTTPFTYAFIFSMTSVILFFNEFANKNTQLKLVNDAHQESYMASITDGMTGLYNHRYMLDALRQTAPPYSVSMLDIDNFKNINDTYGHRFGDTVIQHVAQNLTAGVRSTDMVFRYGGDEFFIIFPKCSALNAREVIGKIQTRLKENKLYCDGENVTVTLSCGIYFVSGSSDIANVFDRVDGPLYISKNSGKDKITIFDEAV